jgi:hypothetical protein
MSDLWIDAHGTGSWSKGSAEEAAPSLDRRGDAFAGFISPSPLSYRAQGLDIGPRDLMAWMRTARSRIPATEEGSKRETSRDGVLELTADRSVVPWPDRELNPSSSPDWGLERS